MRVGWLVLPALWLALLSGNAPAVPVLIELDGPCLAERCGRGARAALSAQTALLSVEQARVREELFQRVPQARMGRSFTTVFNGFSADVPEEDIPRLRGLSGVRYVHRPRPVQLFLDTALPQQHVPEGWTVAGVAAADAGRGVKIGLLDTGIDLDHPMFADAGFDAPPGFPLPGAPRFGNRKVIVGREFDVLGRQTGRGARDTNGHGTATAACAAGIVLPPPSNPRRVRLSGTAPGAWIGAYKVFIESSNPQSTDLQIVAGIEQAVLDGMDVLNLSLGKSHNADAPEYDPLGRAAANAVRAGLTVVVAAGNDRGIGDPRGMLAGLASVTGAISVAAITNRHGTVTGLDSVASFSSNGPAVTYALKPDLAATGQDVYTALSNEDPAGDLYAASGFSYVQGTSFSTPQVAGAAAVLLQAHPEWTPAHVRAALIGSADADAVQGNTVSGLALPTDQGAGRLNLERAVSMSLLAEPPLVSFGLVTEDGAFARGQPVLLRNLTATARTAHLALHPAALAGSATVSVSPASVPLPPYGEASFLLSLEGDDASGVLAGTVRISGDGVSAVVPYFAALRAAPPAANARVLVYDDDGGATYENAYLAALAGIGVGAVHWDIEVRGDPPAAGYLERFAAAIWLTGGTDLSRLSDAAYLRALNRRTRWALQLEPYLARGGALLLAGANFFDREELWTESEWIDRALVRPVALRPRAINGSAVSSAAGLYGNPVTGALGQRPATLPWVGTLDGFGAFSDSDPPWEPALLANGAPDSVVGLTSRNRAARILWLGLPLEALAPEDAAAVLRAFLKWVETPVARPDLFLLSRRWQRATSPTRLDADGDARLDSADLFRLIEK